MNGDIETYGRYIRKQIVSILAAADGLSEEQLNHSPDLPGANSLYVIAAHVVGNARAWVLGIVCGQPLRRDRPAEFAARGSFTDLKAAAEGLLADMGSALSGLDPAVLDERITPPQELWGEGEPWEVSRREALADVLEHAAIHLGHVQMTRDIVLKETLG